MRFQIYVPTFRRPEKLKKALASIQSQTTTDWVCEVINDDPQDSGPEAYVASLKDPRIRCIRNLENWGPVRLFNYFFSKPTSADFVTVLEDDNWWEPNFLQEMAEVAACYPDVYLFWNNMRIWVEKEDDSMFDAEVCIWKDEAFLKKALFFDWPAKNYPLLRSVLGPIHSHGAMLVRSKHAKDCLVPSDSPATVIEAIRERNFVYPIVLVTQPLSYFLLNHVTYRSKQNYLVCLMLLLGSYLEKTQPSLSTEKQLWEEARRKEFKVSAALLMVSLVLKRWSSIIKYSNWKDWFLVMRSLLFHFPETLKALSFKKDHPMVWKFLTREARYSLRESP